MKKSHAENVVGPWARQKLDALESYLAAYHDVMKNQPFKLIYIDAFAGAGLSRVRASEQDEAGLCLFLDSEQEAAQEEFIEGSPRRALRAGRGFDQYYFFDADERRAKMLQQLKDEHPKREINIEVADANPGVRRLARRFLISPYARGVAFLDPYGPHLHWTTVKALADTRQVDVIINFPLGLAINRLVTRNPNIPQNWKDLLDQCFGTHEWYDLAYEHHDGLFGDSLIQKSKETAERLLGLYHQRLKDAFGHTVLPSLVRNTRGAPLYYLMWASSHGRGVSIAEHIMKLGDRITPPS